MDLQKINIKFFIAEPSPVSLEPLIGIFNAWIQASDGDYYDLADYSHVPAGPGVVLVAHDANISIDNNDNRLGLLYNRKRPLAGDNDEKLAAAFTEALAYCRRIEEEPLLRGNIRFRGEEAIVTVNDRLSAPNNDETFTALRPEIEKIARRLFGSADFVVEKEPDPRRRFAVRIRAAASVDTQTSTENLQKTVH
jgi:hypothetical protein